jgi:ribonuclease J
VELAREEGIPETQLLDNGSVLEVTRDAIRLVGRVQAGRVYIDGMKPLSAELMAERRSMGAGGLLTVLLMLQGGRLRERPRIVSSGVFEARERRRTEERVAEHVRNALKGRHFVASEDAEDAAIEAARRFLMHNQRRRPLIMADANGES